MTTVESGRRRSWGVLCASQEPPTCARRLRNEGRVCQALTGPHQPGYRGRGTAVLPTPAAFPSSGDGSWPGSVACAGTVGRAAACGTAPMDARTSEARWAGCVHRSLRDVQRCQALRASRYACAQAPAVIVFEEDSVSLDKNKAHCFHRHQYKWLLTRGQTNAE